MDRRNPKAEDVVAHVDETWGAPCSACERPLIGHEAVLGLMLGFSDEPLCAEHLAARHDREASEFLRSAQRNVARLACYRAGWRHSDERLSAAGDWPEDRIPSNLRMDVDDEDDDPEDEVDAERPSLADCVERSDALDEWDAGDRGCGELALELKMRVRRLEPGARLLLTTTDAGAPADLPAWCRLTGNLLVAAEPPRFLIQSASRSET